MLSKIPEYPHSRIGTSHGGLRKFTYDDLTITLPTELEELLMENLETSPILIPKYPPK